MSFQKYINRNEELLSQIKIENKLNKNNSKTKTNILGCTNKRVFHYRELRRFTRVYRDIPLHKISYIENVWHSRNLVLLILGIISIICGF